MSKYLEKNIRVKFAGGRETAGILKGYDPLLNLVLDNTTEYLRGIFYLLHFRVAMDQILGKIAVSDSLAFPHGLRKQSKTNSKYEQIQNTNPKSDQTQNTKGFRLPRLQGDVYCNLARFCYFFHYSHFYCIVHSY